MNLIEVLIDPVTLGIIGLYMALMMIEALFPARSLPKVPYWKVKGVLFFFLFITLSSYLPFLYERWLPAFRLVDLSHWNHLLAVAVGVLIYELALWAWHRALHGSDRLWRGLHQMHHSAERLDTYGAFYFSPFDMIGFTLLGTLCFSILLGIPPHAITIILLATNFLSILPHANIRTPVWLGYIVQRPESHAVHHAKGLHAFNYSDLPLIDMVFGTFRNPKWHAPETGFHYGASSRMLDMLLFKDVSTEDGLDHSHRTEVIATSSGEVSGPMASASAPLASQKVDALPDHAPRLVRKIGMSMIVGLLASQVHAQDGLRNGFGIGGQVGQHQKDFGIGLNLTSPYFAHKRTAVRLRGNVLWNEHLNSASETTWSSYTNLSLGFVQKVGELGNFMRVYGEGGAIYLFPSKEFSSRSVEFGGYGLFGFEFFFDERMNYFIEAGGVGTGARADEIPTKPIYSNGFLINVGVRFQF
ncbi:MAG: sterol desaturase family protein [Flavobacteriales bacterium]|nr:sterol desaturase family protein [Flavobacteriales bacterium]